MLNKHDFECIKDASIQINLFHFFDCLILLFFSFILRYLSTGSNHTFSDFFGWVFDHFVFPLSLIQHFQFIGVQSHKSKMQILNSLLFYHIILDQTCQVHWIGYSLSHWKVKIRALVVLIRKKQRSAPIRFILFAVKQFCWRTWIPWTIWLWLVLLIILL